MNAALILVVVIAAIVALMVSVYRYGGAYLEGLLDGEYPTIANGDYRNGFARTVYLMGVARGELKAATVEARRRETQQRKNGGTQ